jgi:aminoglycoside phosphotransferase (APT) family kinase protein
MRLAPEAQAWLTSVGVPAPRRVRQFKKARTAELIAIDDLVLRWYGDGTFLEAEPDALAREVAVLTALATTSVPAPRLVAWSDDPPALLTTLVPGEARMDLPDPGVLVAMLDEIHGVDPGPLRGWTYRGYHEGVDLRRPGWWSDPDLWDRMVRRSPAARQSAARLTAPAVVIHRDFHPDNVLWTGSAITGVVDWGNACLGPAAFDVAHYRVNLAQLHGPEATDVLLPGDPAWDVEAALGFLDWWDGPAAIDAWAGYWPHIEAATARSRLERFAARAMAALGPDELTVR